MQVRATWANSTRSRSLNWASSATWAEFPHLFIEVKISARPSGSGLGGPRGFSYIPCPRCGQSSSRTTNDNKQQFNEINTTKNNNHINNNHKTEVSLIQLVPLSLSYPPPPPNSLLQVRHRVGGDRCLLRRPCRFWSYRAALERPAMCVNLSSQTAVQSWTTWLNSCVDFCARTVLGSKHPSELHTFAREG